jgi:hypothetical protein
MFYKFQHIKTKEILILTKDITPNGKTYYTDSNLKVYFESDLTKNYIKI